MNRTLPSHIATYATGGSPRREVYHRVAPLGLVRPVLMGCCDATAIAHCVWERAAGVSKAVNEVDGPHQAIATKVGSRADF